MEKAQQALLWFFWFAFAAFLLASIPHVAYFFRAYEPEGDGLDTMWWMVSFGIAASIDITIFLLSMTVASLQRQKKSFPLISSVWIFILGLAGLSWFINYKYAIQFVNTGMISATPITIPFTSVRIPDLNPIVASCFQALAIAYTWISDKIVADEKPKTAAELEQMANELEEITKQKERIATIKNQNGVNFIKGLIDSGAEVVKHTKAQITGETEEESEPQAERNTDELAIFSLENAEEKEEEKEEETTTNFEMGMEAIVIANRYPNTRSWLSTSRTTVHLETVAQTMNLSMRLLKNRVESKQITPTRNHQIVYKDSVVAWAIKEIIPRKSEDKLELTLKAIKDNPEITDEELAKILEIKRTASARFWRLKADELLSVPVS